MATTHRSATRAHLIWFAAWIGATALQLGSGPWDTMHVAANLIFWIVVIGAFACAVFAAVVLIRAFRSRSAETAMLGSFLIGVSVLPLTHGLLIPGVLYGPNEGCTLAAQLAVPLAGLGVVPLLAPGLRVSTYFAARWRPAICVHLAVIHATALAILIWPDLAALPSSGTPTAIVLAAGSYGICLALSLRHLRLAVISRAPAALLLPVGLALVGAAPLFFVAGEAYSIAFWIAHGLDITGVLLAGIVAMWIYHRGATASEILGPIEATTPLQALEVGLDPLVHRFVADLDRKDAITRNHVVRTAELAVAVADELGLPPSELRAVGLGAILHDVGKLGIPDHILKKPGRLTPEEFDHMKDHTTIGAAMVEDSEVLREAAPYIRGHHERLDGRGYPDGLVGEEIPLGARIVAACDAFDAMSYTRQYREGMDPDKVTAILREHRGAQWDERVVDALLTVVERGDVELGLGEVGREDELALCYAPA